MFMIGYLADYFFDIIYNFKNLKYGYISRGSYN